MKVKKFEADTMPEAMKQVRKELGTEAVILNSKIVFRGGFLGMFRKRKLEVIAAIDPKQEQQRKPSPPALTADRPLPAKPEAVATDNYAVMKEIAELKKMLIQRSPSVESAFAPEIQKYYEYLKQQEVSEDIVVSLLESVSSENSEDESNLFMNLTTRLKEELEKASIEGSMLDNRFIHLVGPTGVGKTTTIAKIASEHLLNHQKNVALITTDTYRIAAIDQLKTYAKILDIPIEVAYSVEDYIQAREKFKEYDLVLVDTAGRNFRDPHYVKELGKVIDFNEDMETHLVLSLTSRYNDMQEIFDRFQHVGIDRLIFTKADETSAYGSMVNMALKNQVSVSYITNGQNVPDDIRNASPDTIVARVMGDFSDD
ncbi:flagellar biosynthesis protein FlhF [Thalassobacillus hwangdonensis]|uniref:Flagellar biosynthesis protein FlhF n=1 Tax=Thalassobacillus hwangdonensis TaxID=546108 RepID=A0ABW3KWY4_9BACI